MSNTIISRTEIYNMKPEDRAKFYQERWAKVKEACDKDPLAAAALADIKPSLYGKGGTRIGGNSASKHNVFYGMFKNVGDKVNELEIFKAMKIGEKEASYLIKSGLQKSEASQRRFISFKDGVYTLEAIGKEAPKGWTGFKPSDEPVAPKAVEAPKPAVPGQPVK